jgi:GGDEF domain-containing protein
MAMLGPMVVVAERSAADLVALLGAAGAFPIVEARLAEAPAAITEIQPAALVLADAAPWPNGPAVNALVKAIDSCDGPFMPVLARMNPDSDKPAIPDALPIGAEEPANRIIARLRSALRVRTLHATVMRRTVAAPTAMTRPLQSSLLDHATVLCLGRGRSYPALTTALGERVGLIGALNVETAARYLNARDIDGIVIGDGFSLRVVDAILTVLAEEARFRDLPVGVLGGDNGDGDQLPNLIHVAGSPERLIEHLLPLVRLQAFESHLKRLLNSVDSDGSVDPETGLLSREAFWRDLDHALHAAEGGGGALSVARFSFEDVDRRASIDAARLFSRLVRDIDFACRERDGAIIVAFTETDLRSAHVVARRLASALKQTMLSPGGDRNAIKPTITLATLKPTDNLSTLVARVGTYPTVAGRGHSI